MNQNQYRSIPAELANHNSWMNWYPKPNPNKSKPDKQPVESNYLQRTHPLDTCLKKYDQTTRTLWIGLCIQS